MKRGLYLLPIILAMLAFNVLALDVSYKPVQDQVLPGQQAQFVLTITNNEAATTEVTVRSVDLNWLLDNDGAKFTLSPGASVDFNALYTSIDKNIPANKYGVNYRIESQSKTKVNDYLPVTVVKYSDVLEVGFVGEVKIDPQRNSLLKLQVVNTKPIDLTNMQARIESSVFTGEKEFNLIKNEKDLVEFQAEPNANLQEGDYPAKLLITMGDKVFVDQDIVITVGRYNDLQEAVEPQSGFLVLGEKTTLTNNGNAVLEQAFVRKLSWIQSKFSNFNPKPSSVEQGADGYMYVTWNYKLNPNESTVFSYKTNYLAPILYALLFVVIVGGAYLLFKKDLEVTKRVLTLHTTHGNVAIMKVLISVRNKSGMPLNDVKVLDKVPASIKAPVEFGMIKPGSVKHVGDHTALVWDIPHLKKNEEKVISYKIEGRVGIMDKKVLPAAMAKFGQGTNKKVFASKAVVLSNKH